MVCYNPYMMGSKIPIYSNYPGPTPKKGYCFFTACNTAQLVMRSTTATQQIVAGKELTYQPSKMLRDLSAKNVHLIYLHHDFPYVILFIFVPNVSWFRYEKHNNSHLLPHHVATKDAPQKAVAAMMKKAPKVKMDSPHLQPHSCRRGVSRNGFFEGFMGDD